jgi:probable F420-dependent oxidoreductase
VPYDGAVLPQVIGGVAAERGGKVALRLGITTPVVNLNPRFEPPQWEREGGIDDIVAVATAADALGYEWVGCPEHVVIPEEIAAVRGGQYWDPVATLGFLAARTTSIGLLSHVAVLGYHHPLQLVKQYGTLDVASNGRVILGVGVGTLQEEFDLLGAEFEGRGERADDALRAIRASFGNPAPQYEGTHYRFGGMIVEPCGAQSHLPIWVGGRTRRSLRRAVELGDGWIPFGLSLKEVMPMLAAHEVQERLAAGDASPFEVVLSPGALDPIGDRSGVATVLAKYRAAGATALSLRFHSTSREHYIDQLVAMRQVAAEALGS